MKISGNKIFITGGGTGIGKALALRLAELGNNVIICGRRENRLQEVVALNSAIRYVTGDISSEEDRQRMYEYVLKQMTDMNVLINNAAIQTDYRLLEGIDGLANSPHEIDINLTAPIMLTGLFIPHLLQQKDPVIINESSILGFMPLTRIPVYCAAKAGYHVYTLVLRKQLEDTPITVYEVPPCRVKTELNPEGRKNAKPGTESVGLQPEEYAEFVIDELEKGTLDIFYGQAGIDVKTKPHYETELMRLK
ncbi:MAG: SDR family NAD(P)-dependent oxidoreductase [Clostridiales bacterium]|nr:SDR family NAD(P)-dependent oxidoreductase [Clostridiales bacterium]